MDGWIDSDSSSVRGLIEQTRPIGCCGPSDCLAYMSKAQTAENARTAQLEKFMYFPSFSHVFGRFLGMRWLGKIAIVEKTDGIEPGHVPRVPVR